MTSGPGVLPTGPAPDRIGAMSAVLARNWWLLALRGAFAILFGIIALVSPFATLLTLVIFFSAYMLVDGIAGIVAALRAAERHQRWGLLLAEGLLNILVGVVAFLMPGSALLAFVYLTAAWALVTGALMIAAAFRLHLDHGRWWLVLGGVCSVLFGIALLVNPAVSLVVLVSWMAAYAIIFGALMLVLAFRLRNRHGAGGVRAAGP